MQFILKGLVYLVGRDVYFSGDSCKLKTVWTENIRFYDLGNFFEGYSML